MLEDKLATRTMQALKTHGHSTFVTLANHLGEPSQKVRWTLDNLRRRGYVCVVGPETDGRRGRPKAVFAPKSNFNLQQVW